MNNFILNKNFEELTIKNVANINNRKNNRKRTISDMETETGNDSDFESNAESDYKIDNNDILSTNKYLYLGFDLIEHNINNKKIKLNNQSEIHTQTQNEFDELLTKIDKFNIK